MTTPVSSTAATSTTQDATALGKTQLASSFNTFLTLLTTQLKNQDPMSPLDSNQFTQQLVQMTGVEQQLASNDLLKQLVANTGTGISTAVGVIGKNVTASSPDAQITGGKASWNYNLSRDATAVSVQIVDSKGTVVHAEAPSNNAAGDHAFTWNGKDLTGQQLADGGPYTLKIVAKDSTGASVPSSIFLKGNVTGVEQDSTGKTLLTINGAKIPWSTVTAVTEATTTTTPTTTPTSTPTPPTTGA
jgi:flagellar basal-body rod modification protein FlgD